MQAHIDPNEPHTPNPNRYIRVDSGSVTYIIKEKEKDMTALFSICTFFSNSPEKDRVIETVLNELNKEIN